MIIVFFQKQKQQKYCKNINWKTNKIIVNPFAKIEDVKHLIQDREGIPPDKQRIIFSGKLLDSDKTLNFYNIGKNQILHLLLNLKN